MKPEDVPAELVEKAARRMYAENPRVIPLRPGERTGQPIPWDGLQLSEILRLREDARHALAAVLPEIQAQARKEAEQERDAARAEAAEYLRMASSVSQSASRIVSSRAARLTATTEEATT